MNRMERLQKVADAVLLEGYVLYPYRATSAKNQYRWTFGVVAPRMWSEAGGGDPFCLETQCIAEGAGSARAQLRFLRIVTRSVEGPAPLMPWEEGELTEIEIAVGESHAIDLPSSTDVEVSDGARVVRRRAALRGVLSSRIERIGSLLSRITVRLENTTPFEPLNAPRRVAMAASFASTHILLAGDDLRFISSVDPPVRCAGHVRSCKNTGLWPVVIGDGGMLCAPFILYDDPQIAPESPGDFFDACEIDELLALRTMTLTPAEKDAARATDARAAEIIRRVEQMTPETMARLHGAVRDRLSVGARVRIRPSPRRTDAQDALYVGKVATVELVKEDVDGRDCFAVTFHDDPAAELNRWYGRYHHYYADELELLEGT